jgi:hypothetical protein
MRKSPHGSARARREAPPEPSQSRGRWFIAGAVAVLVVVIAITVAAWPRNTPATKIALPPTRARTFTSFSACLLTGPKGLQDSIAAPVWTALRADSTATHAQISYLTMLGPDTTAQAEAYINTLALRGCTAILAAGPAPAQGAIERAAAWPGSHIFAIDPGLAAPAHYPATLTILGGPLSSVGPQVTAAIMPLASKDTSAAS